MPLVKRGRVIEDPYLRVVDDAPIPDGAAVIVPAARFLADAAELTRRGAPTGLIWPNDRKVAELAPWLDRLALTNDPNLPGLAPLSNRAGQPNELQPISIQKHPPLGTAAATTETGALNPSGEESSRASRVDRSTHPRRVP